MTTIHTILLLPTDGDPHGLLAEGACGARPPMMVHGYTGTVYHDSVSVGDAVLMDGTTDVFGWFYAGWTHDSERHKACTRALVLAHNAAPVPDGCDRVDRHCLHPMMRDTLRVIRWLVTGPARGTMSLSFDRAVNHVEHLGTLIALDAQGADITADLLGQE